MIKKVTQPLKILANLLLVALTMVLLQPSVTHADEPSENIVGFNYKIEYPDSQIRGNNGYFDLELQTGAVETVNILLSNAGSEKVTVNMLVNGTKTNPNGVIEYGTTDIENDASLKFPFENVVSVPESVELKAGETKTVPVEIKMPKTSFDGIILGGIQMKKAETEKTEKTEGAVVRNTYSYVVAVKLQNNQETVKPEIKFNKASGSQRNYRNAVAINLSNINGVLIKDKLEIESQISKKGSQEILYERKQTGMSIAPNSQMDFYVSMSGEQMVPGDYTARVLATIGDQKWEDSLDFTITKEEADKYNKRDVGLVQDRGLDWKLVAYIVAGVLGLVIIIFVGVKVLKNKKGSSSKKNTASSRSKSKKRSK